MKKIRRLFLILACIIVVLCGCDSLNKQPVTLADSIQIPENGVISADIFRALQQENKAVVITGESGGVRYEWVVFGSDVGEAKDRNLGLEIAEVNGEKLAFRFRSGENFGFSPLLSLYLNDTWDAPNAVLTAEDGTERQVTVTSKGQTVLHFSPEVQTGAFLITPNREEAPLLSEPESEPTPNPSGDGFSETPEAFSDTESCQLPENTPAQEAPPAVSSVPEKTETPAAPAPVNAPQTPSETPSVPKPGETPSSPPESQRPVSDGKSTEKDVYATDPVPAGKPLPVEPEKQEIETKKIYTCTFSIECSSIFNHLGDFEEDKLDVLPKDGVIFAPQTVIFYEGESVYDLLQRVCKENRIPMEASFTPMYNSAYVEGIGNLYEFDCGSGSGWMYRVNGWYPNYGCSRYPLAQGETVEWRFTCDLGRDIGGGNAVGN